MNASSLLRLALAGLALHVASPSRAAAFPDSESWIRASRQWMETHPDSAPHWITPEEAARRDEIGRTFTQTPPPVQPPREVAEFERMSAVLVRYPFGISVSLIAAMAQETPVVTLVSSTSQENTVRAQYTAAGIDPAMTSFIRTATNSWWTRDYGPWFVQTGSEVAVVDFPYNRPRPADDDVPLAVAANQGLDVYGMPLIHTGGNWMTDGYGTAASSDLVVEENPGLSGAQIDGLVEDYLGVERYFTLPDPNNTYIDHIDCWGKFLAVDKVLIRQVPASHAQYDEIEATAAWFAQADCGWGRPYRVYRVYTPNNQPYTNSLILNGRVFVPIMNTSWDDEALAVYEEAMPGYEVLGFTGSWESTDALHCRTKGIVDPGLLHIHHIPPDSAEAGSPLELDATLTASSGQPLLGDSLRCWYRTDGDDWQAAPLVESGGVWTASLAGLDPGWLEYCLQAADASGRFEQHPFTGRADPHRVWLAAATPLGTPQLGIQLVGNMLELSWLPVDGATSYRVETRLDWDAPWQELGTTAGTGWSLPALGQGLFRVTALR
jgi:agmatine deiminase